MFRFFLAVCAILTSLFFLSSCNASKNREKKLIMASDSSYYPYEYLNQFSKLEGFDIDLAKELAKKLHKKLVIKLIPFDQQGEALQKGEIDIFLNGMTITPEREEKYILIPYHSNPVREYFLAFWKSIPDQITSIEDFKNQPGLSIST